MDLLKQKPIKSMRGIRMKDADWYDLEDIAEKYNKEHRNANLTASDVVRHAIEELIRKEKRRKN